jgi:hypothetical protein
MKENVLVKIKTLLGMESEEIKLAQMKLEDGLTIVESDSFSAADSIVIITEDGKVPLPEGDYTLEDGRLLVVKEEGIIFEVKKAKEEEEVEEIVEPEAKKEEEYMEKEETAPKKVVETVSKESYFAEIEKLKSLNESLRKELESLKLKSTEEKKEEVELMEIKEEVNPIVHNPENKKKVEGFNYSQNRKATTLDRVMEKLSK